jgi:hypothetical protein
MAPRKVDISWSCTASLGVLAGFAEVWERVLGGLGTSVVCGVFLLGVLRDLAAEGALIAAAVGSTELEGPAPPLPPASTCARLGGRGASSSECSVGEEGLAQTRGKWCGLTGSAGARGALRA